MNAYCMNCLAEHPPALCPDEPGKHLKQAFSVAREIGLEALAWKRQTPRAMGWRARLEGDDDPGARLEPVSNADLLEQLSHRFSPAHALSIEQRSGGVLERARKQRRLRADVLSRVDELLGQADAVMITTAQDRAARALRYLRAAVDLDDLDHRTHMRIGFVQAQAGRHQGAAEAFERAAGVLPEGTARPLQGNALLMASRARFLASQQKEAWELSSQVEQLLPNDGGVHYQKALVASRYPQANRSVKLSLRRAIDLDPVYFTLAALDPSFDDTTWAQAVKPLLQELEDESVRNLISQRDECTALFRELEDIAASPRFSQLSAASGGVEAGHDPHAETRSLLSWTRGLLNGVEASFTQGPGARSALDGKLHQAQQRLKHWIQVWQRALLEHLQALATGALPGDGQAPPKGGARHLQRLAELMAEVEGLEPAIGKSADLLSLERAVAREAYALELLRRPAAKPKRKPRNRFLAAMGHVGFYLAVAVAILAALGGDLLLLHSPNFIDHPFATTFGCATFTVYLPELVARLTRPREQGGASWRLHDLAFLPAYLLFPVLPAAGVVKAFPTSGMFMLMMAVCALMSLMLIVGVSGRR
jgi:tetratricopeptide (TPR) repeat protein